jgi:hypothetical protein
MKPRLALLLLAALALATGAGGETVGDAMDRLGMLGTWAVSCEAAASFDNPKVNFVRSPAGDVVRHLQVGQPSHELLVAVELAEQIDAATLHMRERNLSGYGAADGRIYEERLALSTVDGRRRTRSMDSVGDDGRHYIENGIVTATGKESVWMTKCPGTAAPGS